MDPKSTILLTGAAGFIGSYLTGYLNKQGVEDIILADEFDEDEKELNLHSKTYRVRVERDDLFHWLELEKPTIDFVFHLGARTDTTEFDYSIHDRLNVQYSKLIWDYCTVNSIPLVYASSAATYGNGELGYRDDHDLVEELQPLNPYGVSKNEFDKWALKKKAAPPAWAGLKFFNVYGPNEYHKERMASVVFHAFNQIRSTDKVKLFKSHKEGYKDGQQLRDFIYVDDLANVCCWLMDEMKSGNWKGKNGLYNLGTGSARTFNDLVAPIFTALGKPLHIEYIDTPADIRDKYQYFTEAVMDKLRHVGYVKEFTKIEDGVTKYSKDFLVENKYY